MKFLITGSAGFIGYNLCKRLLNKGHSVIGIDSHTADYDIILKERRTGELLSYTNFEFIKLDVVNESLISTVKGAEVDYVVHLAAKDIYYCESPNSLQYTSYLMSNVIGTSRALELASKLKAKKFIFASTYSVYGNTKKELLTEKKLLPKPKSPHGASKIAAEQIVHFMSNFYSMPAIILRIFTTYGPEMRPHTVIPLFIHRIANNLPLDIYHDADATRDFIYIDDVVNYITETFNKRVRFQTINIATGVSHSLMYVAKTIAEVMGKEFDKIQFVNHQKDFRHIVVKHTQADISRAQKILGYTPQIELREGLERTVKWYLANPEVLYMSTHH